MIPKDKIQELLKSKGVDLEKIAADQRVYEKACNIAYKSMPLPFRWIVGRKRAIKLVDTVRERIIQSTK